MDLEYPHVAAFSEERGLGGYGTVDLRKHSLNLWSRPRLHVYRMFYIAKLPSTFVIESHGVVPWETASR